MNPRRPALLAAIPLLLALPLAGCYGNAESFAAGAAKQDCKRLAECRKDVFDEEYGGDMGRCQDDAETNLLDAFDALEELGCDYVPEEGRACIKVARQNADKCNEDADQDIADACEEVFDCPDFGPGTTAPVGVELDPNASAIANHLLASWPQE